MSFAAWQLDKARALRLSEASVILLMLGIWKPNHFPTKRLNLRYPLVSFVCYSVDTAMREHRIGTF